MKDEDHQRQVWLQLISNYYGSTKSIQANMFVLAWDIRTEIQDWKDFRMYSSTAGVCRVFSNSCTEKTSEGVYKTRKWIESLDGTFSLVARILQRFNFDMGEQGHFWAFLSLTRTSNAGPINVSSWKEQLPSLHQEKASLKY
jgi:hypothetical protein